MKLKKLYTNEKIIDPNPYVIRVVHTIHEAGVEPHKQFLDIKRKVSQLIEDTWGVTSFCYELSKNDSTSIDVISYWYFCDRQDALLFRLSIADNATRVFIWPENLRFMVYRIEESDES